MLLLWLLLYDLLPLVDLLWLLLLLWQLLLLLTLRCGTQATNMATVVALWCRWALPAPRFAIANRPRSSSRSSSRRRSPQRLLGWRLLDLRDHWSDRGAEIAWGCVHWLLLLLLLLLVLLLQHLGLLLLGMLLQLGRRLVVLLSWLLLLLLLLLKLLLLRLGWGLLPRLQWWRALLLLLQLLLLLLLQLGWQRQRMWVCHAVSHLVLLLLVLHLLLLLLRRLRAHPNWHMWVRLLHQRSRLLLLLLKVWR